MKKVRLTALRTRPPLPQGIFLVIPARGRVDPRDIVRPEGLCQWKTPMTLSGIEPATFQLVGQYLNQLRHRVPLFSIVHVEFLGKFYCIIKKPLGGTFQNGKTHSMFLELNKLGRKWALTRSSYIALCHWTTRYSSVLVRNGNEWYF